MKFFLIFLSLFLFLSSPLPVKASENFDISTKVNYTVNEKGITRAEQNIILTNKKEFIFTPSYTITLGVKNVEEMLITSSNGNSLPFSINDTDNGGKKIEIIFPQRQVGKGATNEFTLKYKTGEIAHKLGQTWEVNIPGISTKEFNKYQATLSVPQSFGKASIIKTGEKVSKNGKEYIFDKKAIGKSGALLIFGESEYYRLDLLYTLSNENLFPLRTEIALPPATAYQEVIIKSISQKPQDIRLDKDGNYLAQYQLDPNEKINIKVVVLVKVNAAQDKKNYLTESQIKYLTSSEKFWETGGEVEQLAQKLKTPENIYNYLVKNFTYNYARTASGDKRLGAKNALKKTDNVVCLEFTDAFVALARAAGIPSRSVEGYAYTVNPELKPLSLTKDVLHAWPQYYNKEKNKWIMIDPTWGNTTSGIDYFNSFDLSHITFVKKGEDSTYPVPAGGYSENTAVKQVNASFITAEKFEKNKNTSVNVTTKEKESLNPFDKSGAVITVLNTGNAPIIDKKVTISDKAGNQKEYKIHHIPPMGSQNFEFNFNSNILTNKTHEITIQLDDDTFTSKVKTGIELLPLIIISGGVLFVILLTFTLKTGNLPIFRRK